MQHADFGPRLKHLRKQAGISIAAAARNAKVSEDSWMRWEQGRTMPQLCRSDEIAAAIGQPVAALTSPAGVHVIADLVVSDHTYQRVRQNGQNALDELTAASSTAIEHALRQHFTAADQPDQRVRRRPARASSGVAGARAGQAARLKREKLERSAGVSQAHPEPSE